MADKPPNFDEMAEAWTDPQRWAMEVGIYNDYLSMDGEAPAPLDMSPRHAKQAREAIMRDARAAGVRPEAPDPYKHRA